MNENVHIHVTVWINKYNLTYTTAIVLTLYVCCHYHHTGLFLTLVSFCRMYLCFMGRKSIELVSIFCISFCIHWNHDRSFLFLWQKEIIRYNLSNSRMSCLLIDKKNAILKVIIVFCNSPVQIKILQILENDSLFSSKIKHRNCGVEIWKRKWRRICVKVTVLCKMFPCYVELNRCNEWEVYRGER